MRNFLLKAICTVLTIMVIVCVANAKNTSEIENPSYKYGIMIADTFNNNQSGIVGTKGQQFNAEYFTKGVSDNINKITPEQFSTDINNKTSYFFGYMTAASSLKNGTMFPKLADVDYNPQIALEGMIDGYDKTKPKYTPLSEGELKEIIQKDKVLPKNTDDIQYSYSLGYSLFEVPKSVDGAISFNVKYLFEGMQASLDDKTYTLTNDEINAISYFMGYMYVNDDSRTAEDGELLLAGFNSAINK